MATLQEPQVRTRLTEQGGDVMASAPDQFTAYIKTETAKWGKVIKTANIRAESEMLNRQDARLVRKNPKFIQSTTEFTERYPKQ